MLVLVLVVVVVLAVVRYRRSSTRAPKAVEAQLRRPESAPFFARQPRTRLVARRRR